MDEAHALKDRNSYRWKNLMSLARNAKQRLMLTGTPLQNDLHVLIHYQFCYYMTISFYHATADKLIFFSFYYFILFFCVFREKARYMLTCYKHLSIVF